jgi:glycosyltransferase involved in cell wall biosynthesis
MGVGLPVVGYDTGALREILGSSEDLVPYGDVDALATKALRMLDDRHRRRETGMQHKQRARALFTVEKMISEYEQLYDKQLS